MFFFCIAKVHSLQARVAFTSEKPGPKIVRVEKPVPVFSFTRNRNEHRKKPVFVNVRFLMLWFARFQGGGSIFGQPLLFGEPLLFSASICGEKLSWSCLCGKNTQSRFWVRTAVVRKRKEKWVLPDWRAGWEGGW